MREKPTNTSIIQFIMYGNSYMFRHYIAIFKERSERCSVEVHSI
jgi:hypothetical protein